MQTLVNNVRTPTFAKLNLQYCSKTSKNSELSIFHYVNGHVLNACHNEDGRWLMAPVSIGTLAYSSNTVLITESEISLHRILDTWERELKSMS